MTDLAKGLEKWLGVVSAAVLFLMMGITTLDVLGRYLLNKPLPGGFEMTEMALAVLIYAALPLVSMRREHIVIDTLDSLMSSAVKAFFNKLSDLICFLTLSGIGYLIFRRALRVAEYGDTTHVLKLPLAPVAYVMGVMICIAAMTHLVLIFIPHRDNVALGPTTT